jgi:putative FmdB family regulatory protein
VPIYEFRCPNGHTFEVFQKITDAPPETCTTCGAGPVEKILFPVAVHFKGSGFYSTDYGRSGKKSAAREGDSSSSEKSADKPAEKTSADKSGGGENKASDSS